MTSRLPPFKSIEAFVIAAGALSFTEAAAALHLTVPAISRRIAALEMELGVPLFQRTHRALRLTQAGDTYLASLAPAIEAIRGASDTIRTRAGGKSIKVSLPASLAANWLVPRLQRFHAGRRDIHVEFESTNGRSDFGQSAVDLAIWFGTGNWPGVRADRLLDVNAYPVCSSELLADHAELRGPGDLWRFPILGIMDQQDLWSEWSRSAGLRGPGRVCHAFDNFHLLYRAAASGLGVALGVDVVVAPYLQDAQLVRPFDTWCKLTKGYYIVGRSADWMRRPVSTFREWLMAEAREWRMAESRSPVIRSSAPSRSGQVHLQSPMSRHMVGTERADSGAA
jgi:LysR family glycine cleavage system transcriptional activator